MYRLIISFFAAFFSINTVFCTDQVEITFFDVGQGNSTLVCFPHKPPLLIDAGSNGLRDEHNFKANKIREICGKIKRNLPKLELDSTDSDLAVVASHGDTDHYLWIQEITKTNFGRKIDIRFLLGGEEKDYKNQEFKKYINIYKQSHNNQIYAKDYNVPISNFFNVFDGQVEVLSAITKGGNKEEDKNVKSVVLKVKCGNHSAIITGDATGETTKEIIKKHPKTTILQACHHGSEAEGCNNLELVNATQASFVIISAGEHRGHLHPRAQVISNIIKAGKIKNNVKPHILQFSGNINNLNSTYILNYATRQLGDYSLAMTTYGIYNTTNQGDIIASWAADTPEINELTFNKGKSLLPAVFDGSLKDSIHDSILKFTYTDLTHLDISHQPFSHDKLSTLSELLKKLPSLTALSLWLPDIDENVNLYDTFNHYVKEASQLKSLSLDKSTMTFEARMALQKAWNNRGLILPHLEDEEVEEEEEEPVRKIQEKQKSSEEIGNLVESGQESERQSSTSNLFSLGLSEGNNETQKSPLLLQRGIKRKSPEKTKKKDH